MGKTVVVDEKSAVDYFLQKLGLKKEEEDLLINKLVVNYKKLPRNRNQYKLFIDDEQIGCIWVEKDGFVYEFASLSINYILK